MLKKFAAAAALTAALAVPAARAEAPDYTVVADYDAMALGLLVGTLHVELTLKDGAYEIVVQVEPAGVARPFTSNSVNSKATGTGEIGSMIPGYSWIQQYSPKRTQIVEMKYEDGYPTSVVADPVYPPSENDPTAAQKEGKIVDPLNAVMNLFLNAAAVDGKGCGETIHVYDGRRRYDLPLTDGGIVDVTGGAGGYAGPAAHCSMGYVRIAGWAPDKLAKGSDTIVHLYAAPIGKTPGTDKPGFYLPVRMWSDTEYGTVVATPKRVTINGKDWAQFFAEGG